MSSSNGSARLLPSSVLSLPGLKHMKPERGPQSHDGPRNKKGRGRARLHERGDVVQADHPLDKFARVWPS
jgi:hypothetical protein